MNKKLWIASFLLATSLSACATPNPQDTKLSMDVKHALNTHPALLADLLRVQTIDRVVYLSGATDNREEYSEAEEAARAVPGVLRVVNKIEVKGSRA